MKIGIDARLYGLKHAGIGRYVKNLVDTLVKMGDHEIVLFVSNREDFDHLDKVTLVDLKVPHYSIWEQLIAANTFEKFNLDVLHVPHFNAPILYRGKLVVTIHDLIKHDSIGSSTTTKNPAFYWAKYLGYRILSWLVARKATKIIVPSNFVKNDVVKKLGISDSKIEVVYEAVDEKFVKLSANKKASTVLLNKAGLIKPFIVYIGSVYPHKNLNVVLEAIKKRNVAKNLDFMLAISCARSVFYERLIKKIEEMELNESVKLLGFLDDQEVVNLYSEAFCLVQPSKMEGFGLTGLEAMSHGLPVISAKSSCLPEVYGEAASYFDPNSADEFLHSLEVLVTNKNTYTQLQSAGRRKVKEYSWQLCAKQTLNIYETVGS